MAPLLFLAHIHPLLRQTIVLFPKIDFGSARQCKTFRTQCNNLFTWQAFKLTNRIALHCKKTVCLQNKASHDVCGPCESSRYFVPEPES